MKTLKTFCICIGLMVLTLCVATCFAQYHTTASQTQTNILSMCTSATSPTNCWFLLAGGGVCLASTLATGKDATLMCVGTDNVPYTYSVANQTWTRHGEMGTGVKQLAIWDQADIYSLQLTAHCTAYSSGTMGIFKWNSSTNVWDQPNVNACGRFLAVGGDGTLMVIGATNSPAKSTNGGVSWTTLQTLFVSYLSVVNATTACAVGPGGGTGEIYFYKYSGTGANTFVAFPSQPAGPRILGCEIAEPQSDANGNPQAYMFSWGLSGVRGASNLLSVYDFVAGQWKGIVNNHAGIASMISASLGTTFGLDGGGHPHHFNVFAQTASGATTGSFNGCPVNTCPTGATHTIVNRIRYPNTVTFVDGQTTTAPTNGVNVVATAVANPNTDDPFPCDPFFGDGGSNCDPSFTTDSLAHCNISGDNFAGGGSGTPIPPAHKLVGLSQDVLGYDGHVYGTSASAVAGLGWVSLAVCGATINGCLPPTTAKCAPPYIPNIVADEWLIFDTTVTRATAIQIAVNDCEQHSIADHHRAWKVTSAYDPQIGPLSCNVATLATDTPALWPCF